jgi:hypothetical protein
MPNVNPEKIASENRSVYRVTCHSNEKVKGYVKVKGYQIKSRGMTGRVLVTAMRILAVSKTRCYRKKAA